MARRIWAGWTVTWLLLAAGVAGAADATFLQPALPGSPPATSASQRFVFRGFGRADGTLLSSWADGVTARLEKTLGIRAPFHQLEIVRCSATAQDPREIGEVRMDQDFIEGLLQQWLVVANPEVVEEEQLLESLTQLLLNRYLLDIASRRGTGKKGMSLPDWFTAGMAQELKPELRQRNLEFARERNRTGAHPSMEAVVGWEVLPEGRSEEKVYCGLMVHWLADAIPGSVTWSGVLQRLVAGKPVDADWLADKVLDVGFVGNAEQAWQAWLAERSENRPTPAEVSFEAVAGLKKRLHMQLDDDGLAPGADVPQSVGPRELIRYRGEEWARSAARTMETGMRQVVATSGPELAEVAGAYASLLSRVAEGEKRGGLLGFGKSGAATADLNEELAAAEALLVALEKDVAIRSHYLKTVETAQQDATAAPSTESIEEQRRLFLEQIKQGMGK